MRPGIEVDRRAAASWEIAGAVFILAAGSALHFAYEWSGGFPLVALFAAVNESVWEHLKLAFWPAVLWAAVERNPLRGRVNNFPLAKGLSIMLMPLAIVALFYGYTTLLGHHVLVLDIATFVVAVILGQWLSCRLLTGDERSPAANRLAPVPVVVFAILLVVFTFLTPNVELFRDGLSGTYGIPR
jgi:hypothetical protein